MLLDFYVTIRDLDTGDRRVLHFKAEDFAHAEEQAKPYVEDRDAMIIIVLEL